MVEGIELRNTKSRRLMRLTVQKATFLLSQRRDKRNLSGVGDHGTFDIDMLRQLGRSYRSFRYFFSKSMVYKRYKVRKPNAGRKSDSGIVPMKSGNSDGGKARYQLLPSIGKHLLHTEVGR